MKDKSMIRSCKALAERACANFSNHYCLPEDRACHLINARYSTIYDGAIDCDYFMTAVLPGDKEQHRLVLSRLSDSDECTPAHTRECTRCGQHYVPASPRQKYCNSCGAMIAEETKPGGDPYRKHQNS